MLNRDARVAAVEIDSAVTELGRILITLACQGKVHARLDINTLLSTTFLVYSLI